MISLNYKPAHAGIRRLAISGYVEDDWYICWCPSNSTIGAEGPWQEWVLLAEEILKEDEKQKEAALAEISSAV